ncbi:UvrABC system protein B [Alishewanella longhuensis]
MDLGQSPQQNPAIARQVAEQQRLVKGRTPYQLQAEIKQLEQKMLQHARDLEFEQAAALRDQVQSLKKLLFS